MVFVPGRRTAAVEAWAGHAIVEPERTSVDFLRAGFISASASRRLTLGAPGR